MIKQRHLLASLAASMLLTLGACDDGAKPAPAKTAKADAKPDAKADAKADADAKPDGEPDAKPDGEPDAKPDAAPEEPTDTAADPEAGDEGELDGYDPRVTKAAKVASEISEDPQKADDVLAAADLDRDKLDALMYEIANDPALTTQYRMARGI